MIWWERSLFLLSHLIGMVVSHVFGLELLVSFRSAMIESQINMSSARYASV